jgi:hypothetical protein
MGETRNDYKILAYKLERKRLLETGCNHSKMAGVRNSEVDAKLAPITWDCAILYADRYLKRE